MDWFHYNKLNNGGSSMFGFGRNALFAAVIVFSSIFGGTSIALADYSAMAGGSGGFAYARGYRTMERARAVAVRRCRDFGGSCSANVAERSYWYFSGGRCDGRAYIGASSRGHWRSDEIVRMKAAADGNYDCRIQYRR